MKGKIISIVTILAIIAAFAAAANAEAVTAGRYDSFERMQEIFSSATNELSTKRIVTDAAASIELDASKDYLVTFESKSSSGNITIQLQDSKGISKAKTDNIGTSGSKGRTVTVKINNTDASLPSTITWTDDAHENPKTDSTEAADTISKIYFSGKARIWYDDIESGLTTAPLIIRETVNVSGTVDEHVKSVMLTGSDGTDNITVEGTISGTAVVFSNVPKDIEYSVSAEYDDQYSGEITPASLTPTAKTEKAFSITSTFDSSIEELKGTVTLDNTNPVVYDTLTAALGTDTNATESSVKTYQWQVSEDGADYSDIDSATDSSYTIPYVYAGKYIRAAVSTSDTYGVVYSEPTAAVGYKYISVGEYNTPDLVQTLPVFDVRTGFTEDTANKRVSFNKDAHMHFDPEKDYEITFNYKPAGSNAKTIVLYDASGKELIKSAPIDTSPAAGHSITITINNTDTSAVSSIAVDSGAAVETKEDSVVSYIVIPIATSGSNLFGYFYYEPSVIVKERTVVKAGYAGAYTNEGAEAPSASSAGDGYATAYAADFGKQDADAYTNPEIKWSFKFGEKAPEVGSVTRTKSIPIESFGEDFKYGLVINGVYLYENDALVTAELQSGTAVSNGE